MTILSKLLSVGDTPLVHIGKVISVPDDLDNGSGFKIKIVGVDEGKSDKDLPPTYPLTTRLIHIYPKVGEYVYVMFYKMLDVNSLNNNGDKRYFFGPIISSFGSFKYSDIDDAEPNSPLEIPIVKNSKKLPDVGVYPKRDEVSIQGRNNSDIIFKNQEVLIRAGKFVQENPLKFNNKDTAYMQLRYGNPKLKDVKKLVTTTETKRIEPKGFITAQITYSDRSYVIIAKDRNGVEKENINNLTTPLNNREEVISTIKKEVLRLHGITGKDGYSQYEFKNENKIKELEGFQVFNSVEKKKVTKEVIVKEAVFEDSEGSAANIVANKINLISHGNKLGVTLLNPESTITPDDQIKINSDASPVPYGDKLVEFLDMVRLYMSTHVHGYPNDVPDPYPLLKKILNYDLQSLLNQNVRTG